MNAKKAIVAIIETAVRIIVLLIVFSFVYKAGRSAYDFGYRIFAERPMTLGTGRDVIVTVPDGKGARQIGEILVQRGLIRDEKLFFVQELLSAYHGKLKSGTYTLNTAMTATEMMAVMSAEEEEGEEQKTEVAPAKKEETDISEDEPFVEDPLEETAGKAADESEEVSEGDLQAGEENNTEGGEAEDTAADEGQEEEEIIPADVSIQSEGQN